MTFGSALEPAAAWVPKGRKGAPCGRCTVEGTHWDIRGWRCELHTPWASWEHPPDIGIEIDDKPWLERPGYLTKRWVLKETKDAPTRRGNVPLYPYRAPRSFDA